MLSWYRYIRDRIIRFDYYKKNLTDSNKNHRLGKNIYGFDGTYGEFVGYHTNFHRFVKYLFLVPCIGLINKLFGRFLIDSVPNTSEYRQLYLFGRSFELALWDWCNYFLLRKVRINGKVPKAKQVLNLYNNNYAVNILRTFKRLVLTFCRNDSAYLEFCNVLVLNLTKEMNIRYNGKYSHLFYTSDGISDKFYFMLKDKFELINCNNNSKDLK